MSKDREKNFEKQLEKISNRYKVFTSHPKMHEKYLSARDRFISKYKAALGDDTEYHFKKKWDEYLQKEKEAEMQNLLKQFPSQSSSSESDDDKKSFTDRILNVKFDKIKEDLRNKYRGYKKNPHSHENYPKYRDRFRTHYSDGLNSKTEYEREWRKYWDRKMNEEHFDRLEYKKQQLRENLERGTPSVSSIPSVKQDPEPSPSQVIVKIEKPDPPDEHSKEKDSKIPEKDVECFLRNYETSVHSFTNQVQKEFEKYERDYKTYPLCTKEKEKFLKQLKHQNPSEDFSSPCFVTEFEDKFIKYWKTRVNGLKMAKIKTEIRKIRRNWKVLLYSNNGTITIHDDEEEDQKKNELKPKKPEKVVAGTQTDQENQVIMKNVG